MFFLSTYYELSNTQGFLEHAEVAPGRALGFTLLPSVYSLG